MNHLLLLTGILCTLLSSNVFAKKWVYQKGYGNKACTFTQTLRVDVEVFDLISKGNFLGRSSRVIGGYNPDFDHKYSLINHGIRSYCKGSVSMKQTARKIVISCENPRNGVLTIEYFRDGNAMSAYFTSRRLNFSCELFRLVDQID